MDRLTKLQLLCLLCLASVLVLGTCSSEDTSRAGGVALEPPAAPVIPTDADWVEQGVVLEAGPEGAWDARFAGASPPSTVIKLDGVYYLYYGGADGVRSTDGGPRHRAIGVATSLDGLQFTKYEGNPIMTHLPHEGQLLDEEEGANSAGVALDELGGFVMAYGGATAFDLHNINADGCLAVSVDGFEFPKDLCANRILDHTDPGLYGSGDEIFPVSLYQYLGTWYVFYIVGGGPAARDLAVAWGPSLDALDDSTVVVDGAPDNPARMSSTVNWLAPDLIVLFIEREWFPNTRLEARLADPARPWELSDPIEIYDSPIWNEGTRFVSVLLDEEHDRWMLYRSNWSQQFVLHTAPAMLPEPQALLAQLAALATLVWLKRALPRRSERRS